MTYAIGQPNSRPSSSRVGMSSFSWRWRKNGDEIFGRSPIWDAFVEVMTGQQQGRTNLITGQKMAEPPMVGMANLRNAVGRGPNGWTTVGDMADAPKPLQEGIQLPFSIVRWMGPFLLKCSPTPLNFGKFAYEWVCTRVMCLHIRQRAG